MSQALSRRSFLKRGGTVALSAGVLSGAVSAFLTACGSSAGGGGTIVYNYLTFTDVSKRVQAVQDAINATASMKAKNLKIQLNPISSWDQKIKLEFASGSAGDLVFTAPWTNNFYQLVANGDLTPLDDLLPQYAPTYFKSLSSAVWSAGKVKGKIYGAINQQLFPKYAGFVMRKDLATKYNFDVTTIKQLSDLTPWLATLKAQETELIAPIPLTSGVTGDLTNAVATFIGGDDLAIGACVGTKFDDTSLKVSNLAEDPAFLAYCQLQHQWYQAGYFPKDPLPSSEATASFKAGKFALTFDQPRPDEPQKWKATYGWDSVQQVVATPFLTTSAIAATMTGIPASSKHAKEAVEWLEIINTDKTVYNLLCHGIAGTDYTVTDASTGLITVPATSDYNPSTDWMFGDQFNALYADPNAAAQNLWNVETQLNTQTAPSVALGFSFDAANVTTQMAALAAVDVQYGNPLAQGLIEPVGGLQKLLAQQKAAGIDDIIAEAQKQLDAWKSSK